MKNLFDSIVRTAVPIIVSGILAFLVARGIEVDQGFESALTGSLFAGFNMVYYIAARLLEVYVSPRFGWLLGLASAPNYPASPEITE